MKIELTPLARQNLPLARAAMAAGKVDGNVLTIDPEVYRALVQQFCRDQPGQIRCFGLGDLVYCLAKPLAKPLKLTGCRRCNARRKRFNRWLRVCWG